MISLAVNIEFGTIQGATKTVFTCPRQVALVSGQVGYQPYLSKGQVNPQKILLNNYVSAKNSVYSQVFAIV